MNLYNYLCCETFRKELCDDLNYYCPEIFECDINKRNESKIEIREFNNPNGVGLTRSSWFEGDHKSTGYNVHYFFIGICSNNSCQTLTNIYDNITIDRIIKDSISYGWGYKIPEGLIYPNIGEKVIKIINNLIRKKKLERILI